MLALYIIAGIILFIVLMLSIPVDISFGLEADENVKATARVRWLFGLVLKDIYPRKKKKPKKEPKKRRKGNLKSLLSLIRIKGLPRRVLKLTRQILGCLKVRQLDADLRVGLDDPADTGMMWSVLWPAFVPLTSSGPKRLKMEPVFDEPGFEVSLHGGVRLFPIQTVWPLLCFVLSPTGLRIVKSMVVSRWK